MALQRALKARIKSNSQQAPDFQSQVAKTLKTIKQETSDDSKSDDDGQPRIKNLPQTLPKTSNKKPSKVKHDRQEGSKNVKNHPVKYAESSSKFPETASENWKAKKQKPPPTSNTQTPLHSIYRLPYGGDISVHGKEVKNLYNTCAIDTQMQILYTMTKMFKDVDDFLWRHHESENVKALYRVFEMMDGNNGKLAKQFLLENFLKIEPKVLLSKNLFGSEGRFLDCMSNVIRLTIFRKCENTNCVLPQAEEVYPLSTFYFSDADDFAFKYNVRRLKTCSSGSCKRLKANCQVWYDWPSEGAPPFLVHNILELAKGST